MSQHAAPANRVQATAAPPGNPRAPAPSATAIAAPARPLVLIPLAAWLLGLIAIAVAIGAVSMLVFFKHFAHAAIPGCHAGSACDQLETHVLGRILLPDGLAAALKFGKWPISFLGLAYFSAVGAAWLVAARRIAPGLRWLIRLGAIISAVYLTVIFITAKFCPYCIVSHAANFVLLASLEIGLMLAKRRPSPVPAAHSSSARPRRAGLASLLAFVVAFVGVTGWLGAKEHAVGAAAQAALIQSQKEIIAKAQQDAANAAAAAGKAAQPGDAWDFGPKGFTGRYRIGPEKAPIRIVMFGAYTCQFCKQIEGIMMEEVNRNPQKISFSFKHFAMCSDCNPYLKKADDPEEHRNACWAARCAEACAIWAGANAELNGEDRWTAANNAFWKAHNWLFSINGNFTDDSLMQGLKDLGFDPDKVTDLMTKPAANKPVVHDIEEGQALGLFQTPMIFINGVELKSWQQPGAIDGTISKMLAANLPALDSTGDRPPLAREKAIADWREEKFWQIPADKTPRALGPADAPVQIVVFGDYQEPNTQKADLTIRAWIAGPGGLAKDAAHTKPIRYSFRNFPGDKRCNEKLPKTFFEFGCLTAQAAESAGVLGGEPAFWRMHDWLMNNPKPMGLDQIKQAARAIGLDGGAVITGMDNPAVGAAIQDDIAAAQSIAVGQIPAIYINGRFVKTWTREGDNVLERIIDEAAGRKK